MTFLSEYLLSIYEHGVIILFPPFLLRNAILMGIIEYFNYGFICIIFMLVILSVSFRVRQCPLTPLSLFFSSQPCLPISPILTQLWMITPEDDYLCMDGG
jgi:hypothetical protein